MIRKGETVEWKDRSTNTIHEIGEVIAININEATIDIRKTKAAIDINPSSVFVHDYVNKKALKESLFRLAGWVADNGVDAPGEHRAARDLLLGKPPHLKSGVTLPESLAGSSAVEVACSLALALDGGVLAIQGPPGSGKTHTAAHMIWRIGCRGPQGRDYSQ